MTKGTFNLERGYGIEIEFLRPSTLSQRIIAKAINRQLTLPGTPLNRNGCQVESYNHNTVNNWKIVGDASVYTTNSDRGYTGHNEIVSPILYGYQGLKQLEAVLEVLNTLNCKVNYHCGIHVHHDVTKKVLEGRKQTTTFLTNLVKYIAKYEHLIYKLVSPSRLDQRRYSTPVRQDFAEYRSDLIDVKKLKKSIKSDVNRKVDNDGLNLNNGHYAIRPRTQKRRACGLNLLNIWTRGSVEFRYHNGSLNFKKITSWIVFTQAIVNTVETTKSVPMNFVPNNVKGLTRFRKSLGFVSTSNRSPLVKSTSNYMLKRFKQLSNRETDYRRHNQYNHVRDGVVV
tara:strand:+ start:20030 stop:21049 length:1020 start_codon:yes stop_codon:yes gene_type:complete